MAFKMLQYQRMNFDKSDVERQLKFRAADESFKMTADEYFATQVCSRSSAASVSIVCKTNKHNGSRYQRMSVVVNDDACSTFLCKSSLQSSRKPTSRCKIYTFLTFLRAKESKSWSRFILATIFWSALLFSIVSTQPAPTRRKSTLNYNRNSFIKHFGPPVSRPFTTSTVIAAAPHIQPNQLHRSVMPPLHHQHPRLSAMPPPHPHHHSRQPQTRGARVPRTQNSGIVNAPSVAVSPSQMIVLSVYENVTGIICTLDASPIFMHMRSSGMPLGAMPSPSTLNFCLLDAKDVLDIDPVHGALYLRQPLQYDDLTVFTPAADANVSTTASSISSPGSKIINKSVRELEFRIKMEFAAGTKIIQKAKLKVVSRNDEPPGWSPVHKLPFDGLIPLNTTRGTTVFRLLAIDPDHEGKITYELVRDSSRGKLMLDRHTGHISTTTSEFQAGEVLSLFVRGRDVNGDAKQVTSEANVTLTVEDVSKAKTPVVKSPGGPPQTTNNVGTASVISSTLLTSTTSPATSSPASSTVPPLPAEEPGLPPHLVTLDKVEFVQDYWRADAYEKGPIYTNILQVKALSLVGSLVRYTLVNELVSSVSLLEPVMSTHHSAVEILKPAIYEKLQSDVLKFFQIDSDIGLVETSRSLLDSDFAGQRRYYILEVQADAVTNEVGFDALAAARHQSLLNIGNRPASATAFIEIEIKLTAAELNLGGSSPASRIGPGSSVDEPNRQQKGAGKPIDVHVSENAPVDALVAVIEVPPELVDALATLPTNERIAFGFINGVNLTHASAFEINIDTGIIRVAVPHLLNTNTHEQLEVFIGAESHFSLSDISQLPSHHFQLVNVWIDDVNNYQPTIFNCKRLRQSPPKLLETASVDTIVAQVIARDSLDTGANAKLQYSLVHQNQDLLGRQLDIDSSTGFIRSTRIIDVDMLDSDFIEIVVSVRDNAFHRDRSLVSYCYLSIHIVDINDNEPLFMHLGERTRLPAVETSIPVGSTPGYKIYQLHAVDHDYSAVRGGRALAYRMARPRISSRQPSLLSLDSGPPVTGNAAESYLTINRDTGWLVVRRTIDKPSVFEFVAEATDGLYTANVRMVIRAFDAVIPPPAWFRREEAISVSEMAPTGTVLTMLSAGANSFSPHALALGSTTGLENQVAYQILCAVPYYDHFALKPRMSSGMNVAELVVAADKLDYELAPEYNITVIARNARSPLVSRLYITVDVKDANDNLPQFLLPQLNISVLEDTQAGTVIGVTRAVDADASRDMSQFRYTLELDAATGAGGSASEQDLLVRTKFSVDAASGEIKLRDRLDFEHQQLWRFDIVAHSGGRSAEHRTRQKVLVQVVDVNDNAPAFAREHYTFYMNGSAPVDTVIGKLRASDLDVTTALSALTGLPLTLNYMMAGCLQHLSCPFRIEPRTGTIYTWRKLTPQEQDAVFEARVHVSDGAYSTATLIEIAVNVATTPAPTTPRPPPVTVPSTTKPTVATLSSTTISSTVIKTTTTSPFFTSETMMPTDSAPVFLPSTQRPSSGLTHPPSPPGLRPPDSHSLEPEFPTSSAILGVSGPEEPLDFPERKLHINNTVSAAAPPPDVGSRSGAPMLVPHFTQNVYRVAVEEEIPTSQLPFLALQVTVEYDEMSVAVQQERTLLVLPRLLPPHVAQQRMLPYFFTDNQTALDYVRMDHGSGQIFIIRSIDFDSPHHIRRLEFPIYISQQDSQTQITGADQTQPKNHPMGEALAKAYVIIDIGDVNDNRPRWMTNHTEVVMRPMADVNAFIAEAYATDADSGRFGDISYYIISESPMNGTFSIDTKTGLITTNVCCLEEIGPLHELLVIAVDGGGLRSNGPMRVIVRTRDAGTTTAKTLPTLPPVTTGLALEGGASSLVVREDTPPGTVLTKMTLRNYDKKLGVAPVPVAVQVVPQDPYMRDVFEVRLENEIDVSLILKRKLDYEDPAQQEPLILFVVASQPGAKTAQRNETRTITITVQDINDNAPNFGSDSITISVDESVEIDTILVDLNATDWDKGGKAAVRYAFIPTSDPTGHFQIDDVSGVMRLVKPLDFETTRHYALIIKATDAESEPFPSSNITVDVFVEDVNDNAPTLLLSTPSSVPKTSDTLVMFKENLPAGVETVEITAADADGTPGNGPPFRFAFPDYYAKSADRMFEITARPDGAHGNGSAILSARAALDRERQSIYFVPLLITDSGTPPLTSRITLTVHVADVNDNPHTAFNKLVDIYRYVGQPDAFDIGHVVCSDADDLSSTTSNNGVAAAPIVASNIDPKSYKWNERAIDRKTVHYFDLNESTGMVRASSALAEGDYLLSFIVSDQPFGTAICNLTVSVHVIEDFLILNSASLQLLGAVDGELHGSSNMRSLAQMTTQVQTAANPSRNSADFPDISAAAAVVTNTASPNRLDIPLFVRIKRAIAKITESSESDVHIFGIRQQQQHISVQTPSAVSGVPSAMVSIANSFARRASNDAAMKAVQDDLQRTTSNSATAAARARSNQPLSTVFTTTTDIRFTVVDAQQGMLVDPVRLHALVELNWAEIEREVGMRLLRTDLNHCPSMVVIPSADGSNKSPTKVPSCSVGRTCSRNLKVGSSTLVDRLWSSFVVVNILPDEDCTCVNGAQLPAVPLSASAAGHFVQQQPTSTCDELFCYNDGECEINQQTSSASCKCPAAKDVGVNLNEFSGTHCQLVARGFTGAASFAWLPPLRPCATFTLSVEFRSPVHDGVILVAGIPPSMEQWQQQVVNSSASRHNSAKAAAAGGSRSDFLALHLTDTNRIALTLTLADDVGEIDVATSDLNSKKTPTALAAMRITPDKKLALGNLIHTMSVEVPPSGRMSALTKGARAANSTTFTTDNEWTKISIQITPREILLTAGDCPGSSVACHSRIPFDADKSALLGLRPLVLRGPLQLGGVPRSYARRYNFIPFLPRAFRGCLRHLTFNGEVYDMQSVAYHHATLPGCPRDIVQPHRQAVQQLPQKSSLNKNSVELMGRSLTPLLDNPRARSGSAVAIPAASSLYPLPTQQLPLAEDDMMLYTTNSFINEHVLRDHPPSGSVTLAKQRQHPTNASPRPTGIITTSRYQQQNLPLAVPTSAGVFPSSRNAATGSRTRMAQPSATAHSTDLERQKPRKINDRASPASTASGGVVQNKQKQQPKASQNRQVNNANTSPVFDGFQSNDKKPLLAGVGGGRTVPNAATRCRGVVLLDSNVVIVMAACLIFLCLANVLSSRCFVFIVDYHESKNVDGGRSNSCANCSTASTTASSPSISPNPVTNSSSDRFYCRRIFSLTLLIYLFRWRPDYYQSTARQHEQRK